MHVLYVRQIYRTMKKLRQNKLHKTLPTKRRIKDGGERIN